jgi:glycosyltransferase involved in cell wall biosynthesis
VPEVAPAPLEWSVAVLAHNEEGSIGRCLKRVLDECQGHAAHIHVIINGASDRTLEIARQYAASSKGILRAYRIAHGDKSNAWNQYVHALRADAPIHFFVDAYAFVASGSFAALAESLRETRKAAAAAVPGAGRSRERLIATMRERGGIHGSLHALSGAFVRRVRERSIRLPLNLYRGDGLIGAMIAFDLDPLHCRYDTQRIAIVERASWTFDSLKPWRWRDVRRELRRRIRQVRGQYESAAFSRLVREVGFEGLPVLADDMIAGFIAKHGALATGTAGRLIHRFALRGLRPGAIPPDERLRAEPV